MQIKAQDLLRTVEQMDSQGFQQFVGEILAIRARRNGNSLSSEQTNLLLKINQGLPKVLLDRYLPLLEKRDEKKLTAEEHTELLRLSDEVERHEADRVAALAELAACARLPLTN